MLKIEHYQTAGFFSCCTSKLEQILKYFRENKKLPNSLNTNGLFKLYKINDDNNDDNNINNNFFQEQQDIIHYEKDIFITNLKIENQFSDYKYLNYNDLTPFIKKYFTPTERINNLITKLINKYNINYNNTCVIRYRGNDKCKETNPPKYIEMVQKALGIKLKEPYIKFLVQTDEKEFLDFFKSYIPDSINFQEIHMINKCDHNVAIIQTGITKLLTTYYFVASIYILARCKYIITTSGNAEMWMMLFRGNCDGVFQYLNPKEYVYGEKNTSYDPLQTIYWLK